MPLFTTALVSQIFRAAQRADLGEEGIQADGKGREGLAGVEARAAQSGSERIENA